MKSKQVRQGKQRHSAEFKQQALARAEKDGVAMAAKYVNLHASQLYAWRQRKRLDVLTGDEQRLMQAENAWLKPELVRISEEHEFLKKSGGVLCPPPGVPQRREGVQVKYAMIRTHEPVYAVCMMCRLSITHNLANGLASRVASVVQV